MANICPQCEKHTHRHPSGAVKQRESLYERDRRLGRKPVPMTIYFCEIAGGYHVGRETKHSKNCERQRAQKWAAIRAQTGRNY